METWQFIVLVLVGMLSGKLGYPVDSETLKDLRDATK